MNKGFETIIFLALMGTLLFVLGSCNQSKRHIQEEYPGLTDKHHVFETIQVEEVINRFEQEEDFYLIMGFPACPWCQALMGVLNTEAKNHHIQTIYYMDIKQMRDDANDKDYDHFSKLVANHLQTILDFEKNRVNAPTLIKVIKGRVVAFHLNTVDSHIKNENGVLPEMTKAQQEELNEKLDQLFLS